VHLKNPDLPNSDIRSTMEVEDYLIKYGAEDWDSAKHPRSGTPPNPGWFAPTDGASDESSPTRMAQNDDPTQSTDAARSIGENRVMFPSGSRDDELVDILEWIANAEPADAAIRAEIKRHYYDVGDLAAGDAPNAALSNFLGPGIEHKDRQLILNTIGPYSQSDEDDQSTEFLIDAGLLLLGMMPPVAAAETPAIEWRLG
jgi:hypothetical protein